MHYVMKILITLLFSIYFFSLKAQSVDTVSYDDIVSNKYKSLRNYTDISVYKDKSGIVFKRGMDLILGKPENPENITTDLFNTKMYGNFSFIQRQKGVTFTVEKKFSGEVVTIENIYVFNMKMLKKTPIEVYFECRLKKQIDGIETVQIFNIEKAVELGEIEIPDFITKEKAITILKQKKELLDLGLISPEEYEKIKNELKQYILE